MRPARSELGSEGCAKGGEFGTDFQFRGREQKEEGYDELVWMDTERKGLGVDQRKERCGLARMNAFDTHGPFIRMAQRDQYVSKVIIS